MWRHLFLILVFALTLNAQDKIITGDVRLDISSGVERDQPVDRKFSPLKAGIMSALVPGSGEIYTGSYLKSALFITVEIASWVVYFTYTKKGDEQTRRFKQYADENWSVVDYADWMNRWMEKYGTGDKPIIPINPDLSKKPWERVNWERLNEAERYISRISGGFSHTLAFYGEQQYYELIGKYHQYAPGWNDFDRNFLPRDVDSLKPTPKFKFYSGERGKANDFYSIAATSAFVIVANHILSAIDASITAISLNKKLRTETGLRYDLNLGLIAKVKLSVDF